MMATFDELRKRTTLMAKQIAKITGVDERLAYNVVMYAKSLTTPARQDIIDKIVFTAQMCTRFGMSSKFLIELIFESLKVKGCNYMKIEDYVRMICIFLTKDISVKIDFVFKCYDLQRDGHLDTKEVYTMLTSSIIIGSDDNESEDQVKELIDLVMLMTDKNNDGMVTLDEFREYVTHDILCIELLGPVMPLESHIHTFYYLIKGKPPHAISLLFAHERQRCLNEPDIPPHGEELYPVRLEMP